MDSATHLRVINPPFWRQSFDCRVIDGLEVLDSLEVVPVKDTKQYRPTRDIRIEDVTIHANPLAEAPNEQVWRSWEANDPDLDYGTFQWQIQTFS